MSAGKERQRPGSPVAVLVLNMLSPAAPGASLCSCHPGLVALSLLGHGDMCASVYMPCLQEEVLGRPEMWWGDSRDGRPWAGGTGTAGTKREGSSAGDEAHGTCSEGGTESDLRGTCLFGWKNMCQPPGFSFRVTPGCFRSRGRVHGRPAHDLDLGGSPKEHIQDGECFMSPLGLLRSASGGTARAERSGGKPGGPGLWLWTVQLGGGASHMCSPQGNSGGPI